MCQFNKDAHFHKRQYDFQGQKHLITTSPHSEQDARLKTKLRSTRTLEDYKPSLMCAELERGRGARGREQLAGSGGSCRRSKHGGPAS
ncbi:hypothetical protein MHYP_G00200020 [Metynnis hypsauchen]